MLKNATLAALLIAAPASAGAHDGDHHHAQEEESLPFEIVSFGDGLAMLEGRGGNVGVLTGGERTFIIDDKFADTTGAIRRALDELGAEGPVYIVNTHWHGDHTGGNANFGGEGATILAHDNVRARLSTDQTSEIWDRTTPAAPVEAWPVITFDDDVTLHLNGQTIHVEHVPNAHTDGDAIIYFEQADVLHMGDIFFNGSFPFIDTSSGGSLEGYIAGLERGLEIAGEDTAIMPGHGPRATREDLQAARDLIAEVRERLSARAEAGESLEEVLADNPMADLDEDYAGFMDSESMVNILYPGMID